MTTGYYLKTSIKNSVFIGFFSFQESHIITQLKKLTSLRLDGKRKEISKKFSVIIQKKKKNVKQMSQYCQAQPKSLALARFSCY